MEEIDRQKFIGGSDVAAILGISPWKTQVELWQDKIIKNRALIEKRIFKRGKNWEKVVAEMLIEELEYHGKKVEIVSSNQRYVDENNPFLSCEIDFELRIDGEDEITNCELKTVHPFKLKEWGFSESDDMPVWYTAQVMHGLGITKRKKGILAALFGADEIRIYPVMADQETIAAIREKTISFWNNYVLTGIPPDPINNNDLSILFPQEEPEKQLLADIDTAEKVMKYRAVHAEINAREAEKDAIEFELKRIMKDCEKLIMPNGKDAFSWKKRSGNYLDQAALKENEPEIYRQYQVQRSFRIFKFNRFDIEGMI